MSGTTAAGAPGTGADPGRFSRRFATAAIALGFAIGGFFDGILLHQVLQWHHLLSGLERPPFDDLRVQILADGFFHVLMYLIGAVGLALLWAARREIGLPGAGRGLASGGLIGFGGWHVLDSVLSHWITGIHRIRMDSDVPLAWDLAWFAAFGLVPFAIGWWLRPDGSGGIRRRGGLAASILILLVVGAAPIAALPPDGATGTVVVFRPGLSPADTLAAVHSVGGRLIWIDASGGVLALDFDDPTAAMGLYGRGALLVSNTVLPAGCLDWSRPI